MAIGARWGEPVLLVDSAKQVTIASKLPLQVVDATGSKHALDAGSYAVGAGFKYKDPTNPQAKPAALPYPLEFRPGATALALNGRGYRGSLRVLKLGLADESRFTPRGRELFLLLHEAINTRAIAHPDLLKGGDNDGDPGAGDG